MCGFAGVWPIDQRIPIDELRAIAGQMASAISHRGPDGDGVWAQDPGSPALAHRRLAILDRSAAGHQPMKSPSGRLVIAFNGEIYNHFELRAQLAADGAAPQWRGRSDTETLLAAVERWGVSATLSRAYGMFAFALWDCATRTLTLARDRLGEKPLYYGWVGQGQTSAFVFGSELPALRTHPSYERSVCREALVQYLRFSYVPAPRTIHRGLYKLEPGCLLVIAEQPGANAPPEPLRAGGAYAGVSVHRWWSLSDLVVDGARDPITRDIDAIDGLEQCLTNAVNRQTLSDVPIGAFLSGGVDSSTVVALLQKHATRPITTFTVGFDEPGYDESLHARAIARHLGTEHHELRATSQLARDVIPLLPSMYGEPFADSSQIATHLVCRAAREHVTVALSGDGGDELFGGYNRHVTGPRLWNRVKYVPLRGRRALGRIMRAVPAGLWESLAARMSVGMPRAGELAHKLGERLEMAHDLDSLYRGLVSAWPQPAALVRSEGGSPMTEPTNALYDPLPPAVTDPLHRLLYRDLLTYLSDDVLCKVDRAAMAVALETRVPMLDPEVVAYAWRLAKCAKVRGGTGKWVLRQVLYRHVPSAMMERPKAGFALPVGAWLRGPLREWAETLLEGQQITEGGYLYAAPVRAIWHDHLTGRRDHAARIWPVLMFEAWRREQSATASHPLSGGW